MSDHAAPDDLNDIEALRLRRPEAVGRWFSAHADALYAFVFHRVGADPGATEDVVQETFLEALRRIDEFDPVLGSMRVWLTWISRNRIRALLRDKRRLPAGGELPDVPDGRLVACWRALGISPLPDEVLERRETAELVRLALSDVPEEQRNVLRQRYWEQRPLEEIARGRNATTGAVKSLLHRARASFRDAFVALARSIEADPARRITP